MRTYIPKVVRLKKNSKRGNAGPSGSVLRCFFALLLVACCLLAATPALSSDGQHSELSSTIDLDSPFAFEVRDIGVVCDLTGNDAGARLPVVLDVSAELEEPTGRLAISIECARSRHLELVFLIRPPHAWQNETNPYTALRPWLSQVDHLIEAHGEDFSGLVLDRNPELHFRPGSYAFLVEKVGTSLRSWGSSARLIVGELGAGSGSWFGRIHASRLRPYVAGVVLNASADLGHWIPILRSKLPASAIWLAPLRQGDPETVLRGLYDAREAGVAMVMLSLDQSPLHVEVYAGLVKYLPTRFVPDPDPHPAFIDGGELQQPLAAFADTLGPQKALIFSSLGGGGTRRIHIGHHPVTNIRLVDLASGRILPKSAIRVDASSNSTEVEVATLGGPLLLSYVAVAGPRSEPEMIGVTASYELTADEIVARLRAFEAGESRRLHHYTSTATLSYHYTAGALNESIDVSSENRFYWKDGVGEYEEMALYINGARWKGDPPSLPFIQAEKVKEVPIEIRLDTSYAYERAGTATVNGRPSYEMNFSPVNKEQSIYSGKAWIDKQTFALNKLKLIQHGLKPPITSSSDVIEYGWVAGQARDHWLPLQAYRQMVFTVLGRAVAVERKMEYRDFVINESGFLPALEQAYRSDRPILRDDAEGYAYLKRNRNGGRTRQVDSLRNIAFISGVRMNQSGQIGSPVVALNYFDFDWRNTGTQLDIAFAGPFINAAWTDPALGRSRWELTLEGVLIGIREDFKRVSNEGNQRAEDLELLRERISVGLARPVTTFSKMEFQLDSDYVDYDRGTKASSELVVPTSTWTNTMTGHWRYHRSGFLVDMWASASRRNGWADWGLDGGLGGKAATDSYQRWGLGINKSFYPTPRHRLSFGASARAGNKLDRLSRFKVGEFREVKIRAWNGTDITFSRGVTGHLVYSTALPRGGVSMSISIDGAVMENDENFGKSEVNDPNGQRTLLPIRGMNNREYITGASVGFSFKGPWGSLARVSTSVRLGGSMNLSHHDSSLKLIMVKTFDEWPWKKRGQLPPAGVPPLPASSQKRSQ